MLVAGVVGAAVGPIAVVAAAVADHEAPKSAKVEAGVGSGFVPCPGADAQLVLVLRLHNRRCRLTERRLLNRIVGFGRDAR